MRPRGGVKTPIEYQFTAGAPRPARLPHPKERHTALVDAVLATSQDATSVTIVAPAGVVAPKFASALRQSVRKRVLRDQLPLKIEMRVQGQTIHLWVVSTTQPPTPATPSPPAAAAPPPVGETPLQARILAELAKVGDDGLMVEELARRVHGKKPEPTDITLIRTAIGTLCRTRRLLVDSANRYSLAATR